MNIKSISEIAHEGDMVTLKISIPVADFIKLVEGLKKAPKKERQADIKATVDIQGKKAKFAAQLKEFAAANPDLHPGGLYNQFYAYWTEATKNQKNIRYEGEQYFDIAKRLATFKRNIKPDDMSKLWEEHNLKTTQTKILNNGGQSVN